MTPSELDALVNHEIHTYSKKAPQCRWDRGGGLCALSPTGEPWCDLLDWWTIEHVHWMERHGLSGALDSPVRQDQRAALLVPGAVAILAPDWTDDPASFVVVRETATAADVRAQVRSLLPPSEYWEQRPAPVPREPEECVPARYCTRCGQALEEDSEPCRPGFCLDCDLIKNPTAWDPWVKMVEEND